MDVSRAKSVREMSLEEARAALREIEPQYERASQDSARYSDEEFVRLAYTVQDLEAHIAALEARPWQWWKS